MGLGGVHDSSGNVCGRTGSVAPPAGTGGVHDSVATGKGGSTRAAASSASARSAVAAAASTSAPVGVAGWAGSGSDGCAVQTAAVDNSRGPGAVIPATVAGGGAGAAKRLAAALRSARVGEPALLCGRGGLSADPRNLAGLSARGGIGRAPPLTFRGLTFAAVKTNPGTRNLGGRTFAA